MTGGGGAAATAGHSRPAQSSPVALFRPAVLLVLIALATGLAFLPGVFGEFVNWDDDQNFLFNPAYRGLGWLQIRWMFTTSHMGPYAPLTWITLGADYLLWGMRPFGYHLTSLGFHVAAAVAYALIARHLLSAALPAATPPVALHIGAVGAALAFSVHPLRVESVVWITERRDVVSGLLYLLAVLAYLEWVRSARPGRWRWYGASLACFGLGILAKSIVVTLPAVLLILDIYPLRRLGGAAGWTTSAARRVLAEKLPFFALAAAGSIAAFAALSHIENMPSWEAFGAVPRLAVSAYGLAFYLAKTAWPAGLSPLYELPVVLDPLSAPFVASAAVVVLGTALAIAGRRRWPAFAAAWAVYVVSLLPVLGVFQNGPQIAADRYTYLACLGWAMLAGGAVARLAAAWIARPRPAAAAGLAVATVAAILLVALTSRQALVWQNSIALWSHAVAADPASARARVGLAVTLARGGHHLEAQRHLEQAVQLNPALPEARAGLAVALTVLGKTGEAVPHARAAVDRRPRDAALRGVLGEVLRTHGQLAEAAGQFRQAVALRPDVPANHYDLAATLAALGRHPEAVAALDAGRRASRRVQAHDPDADRAEGFVYADADPPRAIAAWERYLAAVGRAPEPTPALIGRMVEGLAHLEALRARVRPAASR